MKKISTVILAASAAAAVIAAEKAPAKKAQPVEVKKAVVKADAQKDVWDFLPAVVAEVGGKKITKQEFVKYFTASLPNGKLPPMFNSAMLKRIAPRAIKQYVDSKLLLVAAEKAGFKPSKELAEKNLRDALKEASEKEMDMFKRSLAMSGMTVEKFIAKNSAKKSFQENAAIDAWLKKAVVSKITVTDKDAEKFYAENKSKFKTPGDPKDTIRASHILVKTKDKTPEADAEAKAKAEKILASLKKGEAFEALAQKMSDCPSGKMNKGSLGAFGKGQMVKPFESAAWGLKPGQTSGLVKTQFGYHIIRRDASLTSSVKSYNEVKPMIINIIKSRNVGKQIQTMLNKLEKENKVNILVK
jgi:parvulin-like peptidyl-prolyl isomerase